MPDLGKKTAASSRDSQAEPVPGTAFDPARLSVTNETQRFRAWVVPTLLAAHVLTVAFSMLLSYWERFHAAVMVGALPPVEPPGLRLYLPGLLGGVTIVIAVFSYLGAYRNRRRLVRDADYTTAVKACTFGMILEVALSYFTKSTHYSRLIFVLSWANSIVLFYITISLLNRLQRILVSRGLALSRFIIVGDGESAQALKRRLELDAKLGKEFVGFISARSGPYPGIGTDDTVGKLRDIGTAISRFNVDNVYIATRDLDHTTILEILDECSARQAQAHMLSDIYELLHGRASVEQVAGVPMVSLREVALRRRQEMIKRAMDIVIAVSLMVVAVPLVLMLGIAIKLDSPGPMFYAQVRVGKGGRRFRMYKFRSMSIDAEQQLEEVRPLNEAGGPIFKIREDPRVTRIGNLLRKTSLDELPQLWNVLLGDMSLVGPRPPLPSEVEAYESWHHRRLTVNQGMTGLWQVSGRSLLSFEEMVNLDIYYIENWSIWLDLLILLRTMPIVVLARGAY
jgi:exopolysaccharide biosynthesis polyprenyl glycosylphosphotransferase